jgi:hypothetical protein
MPRREHLYRTGIAVLLLGVGWLAVAGSVRRAPETDLAAPGAPLYEYAVTESIKTMMSQQEQAALAAEGRPPSPGPGFFWCDNCKIYHQSPDPAPGQQPGNAQAQVAAPAQPQQPNAASTPTPVAGSYWCESCKTYHQRQDAPAQRAAPQIDSVIDTRPPSPGEGYYWCENCKTYHLRQEAAQQPGASPAAPHIHTAPPPIDAEAAQALGLSYYCEQCKTYHRKTPVSQPSLEDLINGGVSNSPNLSPLVGPAGSER